MVESVMDGLEGNIIKKIKNGDANAFSGIVERYKDKAYTLTLRILKNAEDAEDSLQEAFVKTFKAITDGQFEERSKFSTYFYRIVYNTALDHYKKMKRKFGTLSIDAPSIFSEDNETEMQNWEMKIDKSYETEMRHTEKTTTDNEVQGLVNKFLEQLPEKYSVILTMFFINDLSHEEISQALKLPVGTVKNRIFRAKEKLKVLIETKFDTEELMQYV